MLRPDVTLYEEQLPAKAWQESIDVLRQANLLIIWWTSLAVYPANTLVQYYGGNKIVIINRDSTTQDRFADILFHENLGKVFGEIKIN
jgi:NAD-dependent deacetylase